MRVFCYEGQRGAVARRRARLFAASALAVGAVLLSLRGHAGAQTPQAAPVPPLAGDGLAWISVGGFLDPAPGTGHGPIKQDPAHPFHGNLDGPGQVTPTIGNAGDPVLKPWAAAQMQASNEEVLTGRRGLPFSAQGRCYPGGVPGQLLYPIEPMYFIQTPKEVWMIWQRDHMVRRIYLTERHSQAVKPSWFGESIGRYENGELVVDTIGLSTNLSFIDNYRTPHSPKEHVTERYRVSADGSMLEASVVVDDPDAFNAPINMVKRWRRAPNPRLETVCAENNEDLFGQNLFPIPQAETPDF